jgi:hypothetical protein
LTHLNPISVLAIVLLATGVARGQEKPFKSLEGGFSVQLPGEPKYKAQKLQGTDITQHMFLIESKDGKVAHLAAYQVDGNLAGLSKEQKQVVLTRARDSARETFQGKVLADKAIELAGHPGHEFKISVPNLKAEYRSRVYIVGDRLYQVTILGSREVVDSKEADAYLSSFKLVEPKN